MKNFNRTCFAWIMAVSVQMGVVTAEESAPPAKWIGVALGPIPDMVRHHVSLPAGQGLMAMSVVPGGPAAQAGIQDQDILLRAADQPLSSPEVLIDAVTNATDQGFSIEWTRGGQIMTGQVIPAERPADAGIAAAEPPMGMQGLPLGDHAGDKLMDAERLREWIEGMSHPNGRNLKMWRFGDATPDPVAPLPNHLRIEVQKQNNAPATVKVERGDETWEVTEDSVDQLPEDVRPHVQRMLGQGGLPGGAGTMDIPSLIPRFEGFNDRFDKMNDQMQQMFEELKQLREDRLPDENGKVDPANEA